MDILQQLTNLVGSGMGGGQQAQYQQQGGGAGGLGGLLNPSMLSGLIGSLMGGGGGMGGGAGGGIGGLMGAAASALGGMSGGGMQGGARGGMGGGGMDLGGLLGSLLGGGGASLLGSLLGGSTPPPAPQASVTGDMRNQRKNENLLRALVYAARADGSIDRQEEASINQHVQELGLGADAQAVVNQALSEQMDPRNIARNITDPNEALQIFALSAALTRVDTRAEQQYIASLGTALGIPPNTQQSIMQRIAG